MLDFLFSYQIENRSKYREKSNAAPSRLVLINELHSGDLKTISLQLRPLILPEEREIEIARISSLRYLPRYLR